MSDAILDFADGLAQEVGDSSILGLCDSKVCPILHRPYSWFAKCVAQAWANFSNVVLSRYQGKLSVAAIFVSIPIAQYARIC
jgi:hypothetical protein